MKWITREKIKVDRVASPWLSQNLSIVTRNLFFFHTRPIGRRINDGTVFDVPNCQLGHHSEDVFFNSILKKYHLTEPRRFGFIPAIDEVMLQRA